MAGGIRHDDLRRRNRALVIDAVRGRGTLSRTELARSSGLSHSTISAIAGDLVTEGILREARGGETTNGRRGRPQIGLCLMPGAASVLAVVLSLNALSATIFDFAGHPVHAEVARLPTLTLPPDALIGEVEAIAARAIAALPAARGRVTRLTMAVQGVTDAAGRRLLWSPITPHGDIAFADILEGRFAIPVTVENDCNMIALALRTRAPDRYRDSFVALMLSDGIGAGLFLRGELFTGTRSSGVEFGHMIHRPGGALCRCGRSGCIEAYAGNYAIFRNAEGGEEASQPGPDVDEATMLSLAAVARARDGREREAFRRAGEALGYGLGSLFALIDPAPVALVGPGTAAFDILEPAMREAIGRTAGGRFADAISFDVEPQEMPLIRQGSAWRALTAIDAEVVAGGLPTA